MSFPTVLDELKNQAIWVAWNNVNGRKIPKSPFGGNAKTNDPKTWGTYEQAESAAKKHGYSGVGIILTDGLIGIDLDNAIRTDGEIKENAQEILDNFASYAEISPSGTGIHVIAYADAQKVGAIGRADHRKGVEIYNSGRYFTLTGNTIVDEPVTDVTDKVAKFIAANFNGLSADEQIAESVAGLAQDQVKRTANETMYKNCERDGVRYARIPTGAETCGFCLMLASRGYVYHSEELATHSHRDCDCKIMPGFAGLSVEGYDESAYYDLYTQSLDEIGGREKIRKEWMREPESYRIKRIERYGGSESDAFDAYLARRVSAQIETHTKGN